MWQCGRGVMDTYETDEIARDTTGWFGFSQRYIRDKDEVIEIRANRAQHLQEQQALEQAQGAAKAVKDVAAAEGSV